MKRASVWLLLLCVILSVTCMVTGVSANALPEDELPTYVAVLDDGSAYSTLQAAADAAQAGDTITLISDVTLPTTLVVAEGKSITLDLAGHDITTEMETATNHYYAIKNYGTLTISDSVGGGAITSRGVWNAAGSLTLAGGTIAAADDNGGRNINVQGGSFLMTGGSVVCLTDNDTDPTEPGNYDPTTVYVGAGATATITGGSIVNEYNYTAGIETHGTLVVNNVTASAFHSVVVVNGGLTTINGGSFTCTGTDNTSSHVVAVIGGTATVKGGTFDGKDNNGFNIVVSEGASATVEGGTFLASGNGSLYGKGDIAVSGGSFVDRVPEKFCAEGFIPEEKDDGTFGVKVGKYVASVNGTKYESFDEAFAAAGNGDTIVLLDDITTSATYTVPDGVSITLDMNGKTITALDTRTNVAQNASENYELFYILGEMTVTGNGTITLSAENNRGWYSLSDIFHNRGGILTIENGTFTHLGGTDMAFVVDNSANHYGDATTIINGGTLYSSYTAIRNRMEQNTHGHSGTAILTINGGNIDGATSAVWAQASSTSTVSPATGVINVTNGTVGMINTARAEGAESMTTISGGTVAGVKAEVGELTVTGGTITGTVTILTSAGEEVDVAVDANGTYVQAVAEVNGVKYADLQAAADAAAEGTATQSQIVKLLADVSLTETLKLTSKSYALQLDLNGYTITSSADVVIEGTGFFAVNNYSTEMGAVIGTSTSADAVTILNKGMFTTMGAQDNVTLSSVNGYVIYSDAVNGAQLCEITSGTFDGKLHIVAPAGYEFMNGVSGGTFTVPVPEELCKNGYIPTDNGDGTYGVKEGKYVASVNGTKYETLADAIANAPAGATVTLLDNIALTEYVRIAKTLTLDLNGYTISADFDSSYGAIYVSMTGNLTLTGDGAITTTVCTAIGNYGKVTIEGGTITAGVHPTYGQSSALYNFYFDATTYGTSTVVGGTLNSPIYNCGILSVEGGTLTDIDNSGAMTVTGGTVTGTITARDGSDAPALANKGTIAVSGGTFSNALADEWCAEGFIPEEKDDGTFGVKVGKYVASVNGVKYETLADAIAAAEAGDTVTLLDNISASEIVVINKEIVFDGAGFTLTSTAARAINVTTTGDVEIKNLTVVSCYNASGVDVRGINVIQPANLTLTDVTVKNAKYAINVSGDGSGATLTINGCTVTDSYVALNIAGSNVTANVTDSNLTATCYHSGYSNAIGVINVNSNCPGVVVNVSGGTLNAINLNNMEGAYILTSGANSEPTYVLDATLNLANGILAGLGIADANVSVRAEYADQLKTEGYFTTASDTEGMVDVAGMAFASVDGTLYETFADALTAAQINGGTVKLLADAEITNLLVTEGMAIDLNGYTLTTNYLVVFNGAYIVDSSDDNSGLLACPKAHAILEMRTQAEDGVIPTTQAPLWDASQNGFVFVQFAFAGMDLTEETLEDESTVLVYRFAFLTETGIARDLLADGGSDNEMSVLIRLSWTNGDGTETHDFVVGDALLGEVVTANGTRQFALSITNYADYENLQFQAIVLSGEHIVAYTSLIPPQ